ncbi:MAG: hypothetical protein M3355_11845 [Actinomycetota bacterium]|nr:hypothetical protein [Actinomycetota bacterium]
MTTRQANELARLRDRHGRLTVFTLGDGNLQVNLVGDTPELTTFPASIVMDPRGRVVSRQECRPVLT